MSGLTIAEKRVLVPADVAAEGRGVIEVFDERGRVVQREAFENFIAQPMLKHNKWQVRKDFALGLGVTDVEPMYPFHKVLLSDSTAAEAPLTEKIVPGNIVGYATKHTYAGTNTWRGSNNSAEAAASEALTKWVWDWPTHAAVGTFRSVCLAHERFQEYFGQSNQWYREPGFHPNWLGRDTADESGSETTQYALTAAFQDEATGTVYACGSSNWFQGRTAQYRKYEGIESMPTNNGGAAVTQPTMSAAFLLDAVPYDAAKSGTVLVTTQNASPYAIKRYVFADTGSLTAAQTITKPWAEAEPGWIATDGTYAYVSRTGGAADPSTATPDPSSPTTIYKVRISDGVTVASWTHPRRIRQMAWDTANACLWVQDVYNLMQPSSAIAAAPQGKGGTMVGVTGYDDAGTLKFARHLVMNPGDFYNQSSLNWYEAFSLFKGRDGRLWTSMNWYNSNSSSRQRTVKLDLDSMGTRTLLGAPVTKSALQTMKLTYQFDYV